MRIIRVIGLSLLTAAIGIYWATEILEAMTKPEFRPEPKLVRLP